MSVDRKAASACAWSRSATSPCCCSCRSGSSSTARSRTGIGAVWDVDHDAGRDPRLFWLTLEVALIAVPLNAVFGVLAALALVRGRFPGKRLLDALIDLPFAVSPVVDRPRAAAALRPHGLVRRRGSPTPASRSSSRCPGIVLATIFVSLPFVAREVAPVLREIGDEQEQAAATLGASRWQTFWRVTLPAIRWGLAYGIVLSTARAIGEFGAVSVVSRQDRGRDRDADAARREALPELRPRRAPTRPRRCWR